MSHVLAYYALTLTPYIIFPLLPFMLWSMIPSGFLENFIPYSILFSFAAVAGVTLLVVYHMILKPNTIEPIFHRMIGNSIRKNYLKLWRGRFVQLLDASQVTMSEQNNTLYEIVFGRNHNLEAATHLVDFVPQDLGIAFYSEAARFRN
ncbi:MAG: hypothetical protein AB8B55_21955 [Mariniblastus sp.]